MSSYETGPTWRDAMEWIAYLEDGYQVMITVRLGPDVHMKELRGMCVQMLYAETLEELFAGGRGRVVRYWPTSEHKTVPGMIIGMVHALEKKIMDERGTGWLREV